MNIFKKNKHSHPLICLEGISNSDLTSMLDYMYNGEVKIFQENLDRFLAIAQRFQLQGLMMQEEDSTEELEHKEKSENVAQPQTINDLLKEEKDGTRRDLALPEKISLPVGGGSIENLKDINEKVNEYLERTESGRFKCSICGKGAKQKIQIQYHIETHVEGIEIPCSHCNKIFRSRHSVYRHTLAIHRKE